MVLERFAIMTSFRFTILAVAAALVGALPLPAPAQQAAPAGPVAPAAAQPAQKIDILFVRETIDRAPPLSLLDIPPADRGIAGARLAIADNNTTGKFMKQEFVLDSLESGNPEEILAEVTKRVDGGLHFVLLDVQADTLLKLSDMLKGKDAVLFNAGAPDDRLREEDCRANVMHTALSRAQLADALGQYLTWKRWQKWFLVSGPKPEDQALADAYRRTAKRFGAKIVEERVFKDEGGSRRADGGFEQVQQQIPTFTQSVPAYDVVVVADEGGLFGAYLPFRTWDPRPVVGTEGLVPSSWHPASEFWGATQFQNRFRRQTNRTMRSDDYDAWIAVRAIGEAATRKRSTAYGDILAFLHGPEFEVAGFKGQKLTFRNWNWQLRAPVFLGTPDMPVTVSPQQGFLHQFSELDTLGVDKPETKCKL
jgi:ABC transporter substrate binding protein (PQQ-dependent alcohol dehydrogenase system)